MSPSLKPVTLSGWYENSDGTVSYYFWRDGHVERGETVPDWASVPPREAVTP